jgi:hypothetical protein
VRGEKNLPFCQSRTGRLTICEFLEYSQQVSESKWFQACFDFIDQQNGSTPYRYLLKSECHKSPSSKPASVQRYASRMQRKARASRVNKLGVQSRLEFLCDFASTHPDGRYSSLFYSDV